MANNTISICFDMSNSKAFEGIRCLVKSGFFIIDIELDSDGNTFTVLMGVDK